MATDKLTQSTGILTVNTWTESSLRRYWVCRRRLYKFEVLNVEIVTIGQYRIMGYCLYINN